MRTKHLARTHAALFTVLAACGSPASQGVSGTDSDSTSTDASTSTATSGPTTAPTTGISATGTSDSEGSGSDSDTNVSTSSTTEAVTSTTQTADPTLGTSTTSTTGETTSTTGPDTTTSTTGDTTTDDTTTDSTTTEDTTTSDSDTGEPVGCGDTLVATIRDFKQSHPDFETYLGSLQGIVEEGLGPDKKPVYAHPGATAVTSGPDAFNQWYHDIADVNQKVQIVLGLTEIQPGLFSYTNNSFFPVDDMLWGNEGQNHNFHFTTEIHAQFTYSGGETFNFQGDDDVWVFINNALVIDLGGVHGVQADSVNLDDLGLMPGVTYPLDVFHAERHTSQSNFRIDTSICAVPQ